jgi:hypothetical protein
MKRVAPSLLLVQKGHDRTVKDQPSRINKGESKSTERLKGMDVTEHHHTGRIFDRTTPEGFLTERNGK